MTVGSLQKQAGNFIEPTLESTKAAAASAPQLSAGDQSRSSITMVNAPGEQSYPITSFVYDFVFKEMSSNPNINEAKARALVDFITWTITDGQQFGPDLGYVPLPENVVSLNQQTLKSLTFNGQPVQQLHKPLPLLGLIDKDLSPKVSIR
jgi:phosphate transport system substrate-binding protein